MSGDLHLGKELLGRNVDRPPVQLDEEGRLVWRDPPVEGELVFWPTRRLSSTPASPSGSTTTGTTRRE